MAVHEVLMVDEKLRDAISKNHSAEELRKLAEKSGMISLANSCRNAVLNGDTSLGEFMSLNIID